MIDLYINFYDIVHEFVVYIYTDLSPVIQLLAARGINKLIYLSIYWLDMFHLIDNDNNNNSYS